MSTVQEIRGRLIDGGLLSEEQADGQIHEWHGALDAGDDGDALLDWLVQQQLLTDFQADALRAGLAGPFMLGPYRVSERLASGRLGSIYRAVHEEFDQPVSLKVYPRNLKENPAEFAQMQTEARASVELEHPNIPRTFQIGQVGGVYFMALEDLQGETLEDRLRRDGAMPYPQACRIVRDAALALDHMHEHGMVHRDVRPANIWITRTGVVKLMELGVARIGLLDGDDEEDDVAGDDIVIGSYDYMAPEQAEDASTADHRSDVYSLGCTLYRCLTGEKPFDEPNPIKLVMMHATKLPPALADMAPDAPEQLAEILDSTMAKPPVDRYQSMKDFSWALEQFIDPGEVPAEEPDEVRDGFLSWLKSEESQIVEAETAPPTPDLLEFIDWLGAKHPGK